MKNFLKFNFYLLLSFYWVSSSLQAARTCSDGGMKYPRNKKLGRLIIKQNCTKDCKDSKETKEIDLTFYDALILGRSLNAEGCKTRSKNFKSVSLDKFNTLSGKEASDYIHSFEVKSLDLIFKRVRSVLVDMRRELSAKDLSYREKKMIKRLLVTLRNSKAKMYSFKTSEDKAFFLNYIKENAESFKDLFAMENRLRDEIVQLSYDHCVAISWVYLNRLAGTPYDKLSTLASLYSEPINPLRRNFKGKYCKIAFNEFVKKKKKQDRYADYSRSKLKQLALNDKRFYCNKWNIKERERYAYRSWCSLNREVRDVALGVLTGKIDNPIPGVLHFAAKRIGRRKDRRKVLSCQCGDCKSWNSFYVLKKKGYNSFLWSEDKVRVEGIDGTALSEIPPRGSQFCGRGGLMENYYNARGL